MAQQRNIKKVVLAYSGGLDTSVILKWLQVNYGCEVITMTADVGQEDDLNGVDEKALRTGATKAYIETCAKSSPRTSSSPCSAPALCMKAATCSAPPWPAR